MPNKIPKLPKTKSHMSDLPPDAVYLSIQCTAESHADRPWLIASFYLGPLEGYDDEMHWQRFTDYIRDGKHIAPLDHQGKVNAWIVDDEYITKEKVGKDMALREAPSRSRYRFACGICGHVITQRGENVIPAFNRLAALGVSEISLRGLSAILK